MTIKIITLKSEISLCFIMKNGTSKKLNGNLSQQKLLTSGLVKNTSSQFQDNLNQKLSVQNDHVLMLRSNFQSTCFFSI